VKRSGQLGYERWASWPAADEVYGLFAPGEVVVLLLSQYFFGRKVMKR